MNPRVLTAFAGATLLGATFLFLQQHRAEPAPEGAWTGKDWGQVVFIGEKGTYTDTFGTSPGTIALRKTGERTYEGTWGEYPKRHGTLSLTLSADGQFANGVWKADEDCEIEGSPGRALQWARAK